MALSTQRWKLSQQQEKAYQTRKKNGIDRSQYKNFFLGHHRRSKAIFKRIEEFKSITETTIVLEAGSGPHGIIFFSNRGQRIALDPLAHFYYTEFNFLQKDSGVFICEGMGEKLPFVSKVFDVVVCDNVLDHTKSAADMLAEIHRVLKDDGILYLAVNLHHRIFRFFNILFNSFYSLHITLNTPNYKTHTYFFTPGLLKKMINRSSLKILEAVIPPLNRFKLYKNVYSAFICQKLRIPDNISDFLKK